MGWRLQPLFGQYPFKRRIQNRRERLKVTGGHGESVAAQMKRFSKVAYRQRLRVT